MTQQERDDFEAYKYMEASNKWHCFCGEWVAENTNQCPWCESTRTTHPDEMEQRNTT